MMYLLVFLTLYVLFFLKKGLTFLKKRVIIKKRKHDMLYHREEAIIIFC